MRFNKAGAMAAALLSIVSAVSCQPGPKLADGLYAVVETVKGSFTFSLDYERAPLAAANFVGLAEGTLDSNAGRRFYDGLSFHRVEPGFVVQGGDPIGDGSGDPGYNFPDEFDPAVRHDAAGVVAMANHGPDTNGSQFYITLDAAPFLDDSYTAFGRVVDGMDVVESIAAGDVMTKVTIRRVGDAAKAFETDQAAWNRYYGPAAEASKVRALASRQASVDQILEKWPGLQRQPTGILSEVLEEGSGPTMRRGYLVNVSYKGMLPDGRVFDQSILHGGPIEFELGIGQVIIGWDIVIEQMRKGERRLVAIPPELAYGTQGAGGVIPPNSYLVFELEVTGYTE